MKKIALLYKKEKKCTDSIVEYCHEKYSNIVYYGGYASDPFPIKKEDCFDVILSFLSPWIVPAEILNHTEIAINFHPGPPEYPGIGCYNFALYDQVVEYGVTCHYMLPKVDTGKIIAVKRFPISQNETVVSLSLKSYTALQELFYVIFDCIVTETTFPDCCEKWLRKPYVRKELDNLCKIDLSMSTDEILRRVRATTWPGKPGAYFRYNNISYEIRHIPNLKR